MTTCKTVGELIAALQKYPPEAGLVIDGPDIGGYDVTHCPEVSVSEFAYPPVSEQSDLGSKYDFSKFGLLVELNGILRERDKSRANLDYGDDWWDLARVERG